MPSERLSLDPSAVLGRIASIAGLGFATGDAGLSLGGFRERAAPVLDGLPDVARHRPDRGLAIVVQQRLDDRQVLAGLGLEPAGAESRLVANVSHVPEGTEQNLQPAQLVLQEA